MKKIIMMISLLTAASFAMAQDVKLSAGLGGVFDYSLLYSKTDVTIPFFGTFPMETNGTAPSLGGSAYLDVTYVLLSVDYLATLTSTTKTTISGSSSTSTSESQAATLNVGLYAKYPFVVTKNITLFPMVGGFYGLNLALKGKDSLSDSQKADLNDIWVSGGFGCDFSFDDMMKGFYIRPIAVFNYDLTPPTSCFVWTVKGGVYAGLTF